MNLFTRDILSNPEFQTIFGSFKDTGVFERYMLNGMQFAAAKSREEAWALQAAVFNDAGDVRGYSEFKAAAKEITDIMQENWLRTEYDMSRQQMVAAQQFRRMRDDADLYPYWVWRGRMDSRERVEHVDMEGKVFRIGDPDGDACFPPADWNCRCDGEPVDGRYLEDNKTRALTPREATELLYGNDADGNPHIDPQFRFNPADQGMLPRSGRYFEKLPSANSASGTTFAGDQPTMQGSGPGPDMFASRGLHHLLGIVNGWRDHYHTDRMDRIIFQDKGFQANIAFDSKVLHEIGQHPRGFELLPETLEKPTEVWMQWIDFEKQLQVSKNYISFDRSLSAYVVQVESGEVVDAFAVANSQIGKYRKGLPFISH